MMEYSLTGNWKYSFNHIKEIDSINESIFLPNTISNAKVSPITDANEYDCLTDERFFEGTVFFYKEIELDQIDDKDVYVYLERTRISTVYFDGKELDTKDSFVAPHTHSLPSTITAGKHLLVVKVANTGYKTSGGHMTSKDTQTNWLGILGEIKIVVREKYHINRITIKTEIITEEHADLTVKAYVNSNNFSEIQKENIYIKKINSDEKVSYTILNIDNSNQKEMVIINLRIAGKNITWDEYERNLYSITIKLNSGEEYSDSFGIRHLSSNGLKLMLNNHQIYLRGKHDGMIWPLTGFAPMDKDSWLKRFEVAKEYGINHYRFHTCCPPNAAFEAADELGIYLEPEIPFWGTIVDPNETGYNQVEQDFLWQEGYRIIDTFGNHPSFVMFSLGNELWGNKQYINEKLDEYKKYDDRFWYLGGSNSFQFDNYIMPAEDIYSNVRFGRDRLFRGSYAMCDAPLGFVQDREPGSYSYDSAFLPGGYENIDDNSGKNLDEKYIEIQYGTGTKKVKISGDISEVIPDKPVISHEIGQYYFYPNLSEQEKYTGVLKAKYLDYYKQNMLNNNVYAWRDDYKKASGLFSIECYKLELEAALMTENLSGFQLLDLQDFNGQGVALVGILDSFMDSKGLISSDKWRGFCGAHVIMAKFEKFVFDGNEKIVVPIIVSVADYYKTNEISACYELYENEELISSGSFGRITVNSRNTLISHLNLSECIKQSGGKATNYRLKLLIDDNANEYEFYVFPNDNIIITNEMISDGNHQIKIVRTLEEAKIISDKGDKVICIPDDPVNGKTGDFTDCIPGFYAPEFWNYKMFKSISVQNKKPEPLGTLGLFIDCENNVLKDFPAKNYSTPIWYNFVMHGFAKEVSCDQVKDNDILVHVIDNPERCKRLAMLYYVNGILVCNSRLCEISDKPEIKSLARSILNEFFLV